MNRIFVVMLMFVSWLGLVGVASAQTLSGDGWPPQTALFNDATFLAKAIPFLIALGIVVGILQARSTSQKGGDAIIGEEVRRHDTGILLIHWMNAVGLILGLVSGAMVLRWVNRPLVERPVFIIHYIGAALTIFSIFNHLAREGISGGTDLLPKRFSVIRDLIGELFEYIGLFGPKGAVLRIPWPKAIRQPIAKYFRALFGYKEDQSGKYLATEKILSYPPWAILITVIVVTGLIKILRYVFEIPSSFIAATTAIHDLAAVGIGVMLIIHLLPLLLVPANWPLLMSIFRTTVPLKYVEERHPIWYKELKANQKLREPASEDKPVKESQAADALSAD